MAAVSPFILAAVVLGAGAAALWAYREFDLYGGRGTGRTSDSDSLRGKTGRVTERVTATDGEVKLEEGGFNPHYQARTVSGSIEVGEEVIVVEPGGGNVVTVEALSQLDDGIDRELARERRRHEREESGSSGSEHERDRDRDGEPETA
jgi:membrane protein implicated in regulation of membrane protease activity